MLIFERLMLSSDHYDVQIDGGSNLSIKMHWSHKLECSNGEYSLNAPFTFPDFFNPTGKRMSKGEKIRLNVDVVAGSELLFKTTSHPLQEMKHHAWSMGFLCDNKVLSWSKDDFSFSYAVSPSHINRGVLLESASAHDFDQREMFYIYLSPGDIQNKNKKVMVVDLLIGFVC